MNKTIFRLERIQDEDTVMLGNKNFEAVKRLIDSYCNINSDKVDLTDAIVTQESTRMKIVATGDRHEEQLQILLQHNNNSDNYTYKIKGSQIIGLTFLTALLYIPFLIQFFFFSNTGDIPRNAHLQILIFAASIFGVIAYNFYLKYIGKKQEQAIRELLDYIDVNQMP